MAAMLLVFVLLSGLATPAQTSETGRQVFVSRCAGCHGTDGNGGELGPAVTTRVPLRSDQDLTAVIHDGIPAAGMPAFANLSASDSSDLVRFLRTLKPRNGSAPPRISVTIDGRKLSGIALNQTQSDLQVLTEDAKIRLLRKTDGGYRAVTSQAD